MKKEKTKNFYFALCMLTAFLLWTIAIRFVDVAAIGPLETTVGFSTINHFVHNLTGTNMVLYTVTDWLGLVPLMFVMGFGLLGLIQWIKRKHILKVDFNILVLGVFYVVVFAIFLFFEYFVINYRPVLIDGILEASYPSSTTMLVMCVMPTAIIQFKERIKNNLLKRCIIVLIVVFTIFMVIGRLISGVHWFSDIIGGALLSAGLVGMYRFVCAARK